MPKIKIVRKKQTFAPANCCFHVYIDGVKETTLSNGDHDTFSVSAGTHTLQINNNWFTGKKIQLEVTEKETVSIQTYSRPIMGWLYVTAPVALTIIATLRLFKVNLHPYVLTASMVPLFLFIVLAAILGGLRKVIMVKMEGATT